MLSNLVVKHLQNGKSSREIAQIMSVGRTQIHTINKRKAEILEDYDTNQLLINTIIFGTF
jgi:predicted DNA-binding protein YlxM (UPF0122 family)